ncbi:MAG: DUF1513 domain-containing protein [Pseudomonadota bacterium]
MGLGALLSLSAVPSACRRAGPDRSPSLIGCCALRAGGFAAVVLDGTWQPIATIPLPARGHGIAVAPHGQLAVVLGRRPSRTATVIDLQRLQPLLSVETPAQRHLFGHGFFSPDGELFYATENDFEGPDSVLGVYDVSAGFRRLGEMSTAGIGAHEAVLLADGATIAVANGGIETHPDYPRHKLNLAEMRPSLAYLRAADGALLEQVSLPARWHQVSLRHLAQASDGSLWIGGQDEGAGVDAPLVLRHVREDTGLQVIGNSEQTRALAGYVGSVAAHRGRPIVTVTSPRGNHAHTYDAATGRLLDATALTDVCGVAASHDRMIVSTGEGEVRPVQARRAGAAHRALRWDNHLSAVVGAGGTV